LRKGQSPDKNRRDSLNLGDSDGWAPRLHSAHVLPASTSTFSGTLKPAGVLSIAATTTRRVTSEMDRLNIGEIVIARQPSLLCAMTDLSRWKKHAETP
jgi:hypothetical protein